MAKISINLLPPEIMVQEAKKARFYKIQFAGILVILVMFFLASLVIALRILQSRNITSIQATLAQEEQKVTDLKTTQGSLLLLKDRLNVIDKYFGVPSKQSTLYDLLNKLIPPSVIVNEISIDNAGIIALSATVPDSIVLDRLIVNLTLKEINEGKINNVSVEALNRGRDGYYRISFKLTTS